MPVDSASFVFIISLAAVVNGLGIVRWLTGFTEYIKRRMTLKVHHYWVYSLTAAFQFLLHVLFWWSLWSIRGTSTINFLSYLYLLTGPVLLFIGTAVLHPEFDDDNVDLRRHYFAVRSAYATVLALAWVWAVFLSPVLRGSFAANATLFSAFLVGAVVQRLSSDPAVNGVLAVANWLLLCAFIALYQLQLGGNLPFGR